MVSDNGQKRDPHRSEPAAHDQLAALMSAASHAVYGTRWFTNLEYLLWEALEKGDPHPFTTQQLLELRALAEASGGWVRREHGKSRHVPLEEWRRHYDQYKGERR
jgi:hypothetical protein